MNNRIIPVTLAVADAEQKKRFERMIAASPMVRLVDEESDEMGVLIYEPSANVEEDLPYIIQALESGQAEDVYLAGNEADPEILIRAMRSGIREFLRYPIEENDFRAAVMRTAMRTSLEDEEIVKGRIITLLGAKPGLGSTTLAVSLAATLNETAPGRTVLLDLRRPVGEAHYFLDLSFDYTWADLAGDISRLDATYLQSVVAEHSSGLHVLPGPADGERPDPHALFLILEQLRHSYDHVIVDTSYPDDGNLPKEVEHADLIGIALELSLPCLARTSRLVDLIQNQDPDAERRMKLIATRVAKGTSIGVGDAAEVLDREIAWAVPEDAQAALSAINQGTPLVTAYPKSAASKAIRKIASTLAPSAGKSGKGLSLPFSSLFKRKSKDAGNDNLAGVVS